MSQNSQIDYEVGGGPGGFCFLFAQNRKKNKVENRRISQELLTLQVRVFFSFFSMISPYRGRKGEGERTCSSSFF
jgi:hypothetical protein